MIYTHRIDFFSNCIKVRVEQGVVVAADGGGIFATTCPECGEPIAGYWLAFGHLVQCPSDGCGDWPLIDLNKKVKG